MVMGVTQFQRLFREAASIDLDKDDIKRLDDFVTARLHDLLLMAQRLAKANGRPVIDWIDVPLTKGLQVDIHNFQRLEEAVEVEAVLERLATLPQLDLDFSEDLEARLPELAGGITYSLARVFRAVDPTIKNPSTHDWRRIEEIYGILL